MPYFQNAKEFGISGGTFSDVGGDQITHNNAGNHISGGTFGDNAAVGDGGQRRNIKNVYGNGQTRSPSPALKAKRQANAEVDTEAQETETLEAKVARLKAQVAEKQAKKAKKDKLAAEAAALEAQLAELGELSD